MTLNQAQTLLAEHGHTYLLRFWERLNVNERNSLLQQVATLDFAAITRMQKMLTEQSAPSSRSEPAPAEVIELTPEARAHAFEIGSRELQAGKIGVVLVAGGQGSRLGYDGPKGAYPIGPVSNAVLFYFHTRKVLALSQQYKVRIPLYIMTSDANHQATLECFATNNNFGMPAEDLFFFQQGMWPALDENGKIIMDAPGHIFMGPDGHGGTLSALAASGALADMEKRGLSTVFYFQVDNPLVEVADPAFIGVHLQKNADFSLKVCAKRDPNESVGVVVKRDGRHEMIEYTELTDEQKNQRRANGDLYFKYGSVAIHIFSLPFLKQEALSDLPLHLAHKKIPVCDDRGITSTPKAPNGYKFEKFIFDVLPDAENVTVLAFERRNEFSPVKNAIGENSPQTCRRDLSAKWSRWLKSVGIDAPSDEAGYPLMPIEIDPCFAVSPEILREHLQSKPDVTKPIWLKID